MRHLLLIAITAITAITALGGLTPAQAAPAWPAFAPAATAPAPQPDERRVTFAVEGMTCGHCATSLAAGLRRVEGVLDARVALDERRAQVRYDAQRVTVERLIEAVEELGYRVELESEG
ncbi:MAG: hypothetical protein CVU56_00770 [Deltaproteobacteria bacterium HGW-Deltaproteobacteria-14]|jgi:copper chaperone CopZ|nr:MAG: hypothetical protein CVU56_00770 [Deltaproteobacteria bacterium HGW-Deltaproteobacteria-14]